MIMYPFWTTVRNVLTYGTTKQLEKNAFTIIRQNINQEICIQVTFGLEIKLQKYIFLQNTTIFLTTNVSFLNHC